MVETLLDMMKATLVSGKDVMITGFGKSSVKNKRERRGLNPATGVRYIVFVTCFQVLTTTIILIGLWNYVGV